MAQDSAVTDSEILNFCTKGSAFSTALGLRRDVRGRRRLPQFVFVKDWNTGGARGSRPES